VSAYVQSELDVLDVVATDWLPTRAASRQAVRVAIMRAAAEHRGLVHAGTMREHLPPWVDPHQIGATVCALVRKGYLKPTGRLTRSGDPKSRNRAKASEVRRLVKPIPPEAVK
jgi:hypothetical protein